MIWLLKLYFATHLVEAFTKQFDELLSWAEILAMECACSDDAEEVEKQWNSVSNGETTPSPTGLSPIEEFTDGVLNRLMLKHKLVVFEKSPFDKSNEESVDAMYHEARSLLASGEIEKSLRRLDEYEREFASQSIQRDLVYSSQLRSLTTEHAEKAILCLRGPVHYDTLPILLRRDEVDFSSYLFTEPYVQPLGEVVVSRIIHGQALDDDTLTRIQIYQDFVSTYDYKSKLECSEKALAMTVSQIEDYKKRL